MRGKFGIVVGIGIGYVLGARAGRKRYEQIKERAGELWQQPFVQEQAERVKTLATSSALLIPRAAWSGVVKVVGAVASSSSTSEAKTEAGRAAKDAAGAIGDAATEVGESAKRAARDVRDTADDVKDTAKRAAGDLADSAKDAADDVKDTAGDIADDVKDTAGDVADDVKRGAEKVAKDAEKAGS